MKNNRWYDEYPELSEALGRLKHLNEQIRYTLLNEVKKVILRESPGVWEELQVELPDDRRRWYDMDEFAWKVINCLEQVSEETINVAVIYLNKKLEQLGIAEVTEA